MTVKSCNVLLVAPKFLRESFFSLQASCKVARARYPAAPLSLMTVAALLPTQWTCRLIDHNIDDVTDADIAWADLVMTGGMITQRFGCLDFMTRVQAAGKPVAVGGPDVTGSPHLYAQADFVVIGEAEVVIKDFIADWESGQRRGTYRAEKFKIDVTRTPVPRYDLIRHRDYLYLNVQFSRGCPFTCEFCDIIELYGRMPRVKTPQQLIAELEAIYRVGYRGHVDFVDDNFIGNKKAVKAFLPHLIDWQKKRKYPFEFSTEASANLADDNELLAMMREANFFFVFVGIESPDTTTLVSMQKKQNTRRVLADSIHKIYRAGMFVNAGFIVGFDTEKDSVAEGMIRCIEDTSIPVAVVGLLYALPNTQLTTRLRREQRFFPEGWEADAVRAGRHDQCSAGLNFETARPRRDILSDLRTILDRIYAPGAYFARVRHVMGELDRFRPPNKSRPKRRSIGGVAIADLLLLLVFVAVKHPRLWLQFARTMLFCLVNKPACMKSAMILSIMYLHIGPFSRTVMAAVDRQIELIDRDEWRSPLAALPHGQIQAPSIAATAEAASSLIATADTAA